MKNDKLWEVTIRPPPGCIITVFTNGDAILQFPRGNEGMILDWFDGWRRHIEHELRMSAQKPQTEDPQITEVKRIISNSNQNIMKPPVTPEGNPPTPTEGTSPDAPNTWATTKKIDE